MRIDLERRKSTTGEPLIDLVLPHGDTITLDYEDAHELAGRILALTWRCIGQYSSHTVLLRETGQCSWCGAVSD
jgi:hypothetical protein